MNAFHQYLKQFPNYSPKEFEYIKPYLSTRNIQAGEYFLQDGKICRHIGFVEYGLFRTYYLNNGKEFTKCFCKENSIITSFNSLTSQQASDVAIQAIEDSSIIVFSFENLKKLYEKSIFWQQVGRLVAESELLENECYNRFLRDLNAMERYNHILTYNRELLQRVPLKYLASYIQVSPETLSRIRNKVIRN